MSSPTENKEKLQYRYSKKPLSSSNIALNAFLIQSKHLTQDLPPCLQSSTFNSYTHLVSCSSHIRSTRQNHLSTAHTLACASPPPSNHTFLFHTSPPANNECSNFSNKYIYLLKSEERETYWKDVVYLDAQINKTCIANSLELRLH